MNLNYEKKINCLGKGNNTCYKDDNLLLFRLYPQ